MKLIIKVEKILFPKTEPSGEAWYILSTDMGIIKGKIPWHPSVDEELELEGKYVEYQGQKQFAFNGVVPHIPQDSHAQLQYVCERAKGIGVKLQEEIWNALGENWKEIKQDEVHKITPAKYLVLMEAIDVFELEKDKSEAISYLISKGCTLKMGVTAYSKWEKQTVGVVNNNCFRLTELPNYGFSDVDKVIRHSFNIKDNDPRRIKAAVIYSMQLITADGSTIADWANLKVCIQNVLPQMNLEIIANEIKELFKESKLIAFEKSHRISLAKHYEQEKQIWHFIGGWYEYGEF
jgi:hypothetical protein